MGGGGIGIPDIPPGGGGIAGAVGGAVLAAVEGGGVYVKHLRLPGNGEV